VQAHAKVPYRTAITLTTVQAAIVLAKKERTQPQRAERAARGIAWAQVREKVGVQNVQTVLSLSTLVTGNGGRVCGIVFATSHTPRGQ